MYELQPSHIIIQSCSFETVTIGFPIRIIIQNISIILILEISPFQEKRQIWQNTVYLRSCSKFQTND